MLRAHYVPRGKLALEASYQPFPSPEIAAVFTNGRAAHSTRFETRRKFIQTPVEFLRAAVGVTP
jgi:hypothetical protein